MTFYEVLGVARNATLDEIKKAYRQLALKHHPDQDGEAKKFKEITTAFETLSDINRRNRYDNYDLKKRPSSPPPSPPKKKADPPPAPPVVECSYFGGTNSGRNILVHIKTTSKELKEGGKKSVVVRKKRECERCMGEGSSRLVCQSCNGHGRLIHLIKKFVPIDMAPQCTKCKGTGATNWSCLQCKGQGVLNWINKEVFFTIPPGSKIGEQITLLGEGEAGPKKAPGFLRVVLT